MLITDWLRTVFIKHVWNYPNFFMQYLRYFFCTFICCKSYFTLLINRDPMEEIMQAYSYYRPASGRTLLYSNFGRDEQLSAGKWLQHPFWNLFKALNGMAPHYISDLIRKKSPPRSVLWSNDLKLLVMPRTKCKTFGDRAVAYAALSMWNKFPKPIQMAPKIYSFKKQLKHICQSEKPTKLSQW